MPFSAHAPSLSVDPNDKCAGDTDVSLSFRKGTAFPTLRFRPEIIVLIQHPEVVAFFKEFIKDRSMVFDNRLKVFPARISVSFHSILSHPFSPTIN